MYVNNPWTARQLALEYTRDRIREAQAAQAARAARAARATQEADLSVTDVPDRTRPLSAQRTWWEVLRRRPTTA